MNIRKISFRVLLSLFLMFGFSSCEELKGSFLGFFLSVFGVNCDGDAIDDSDTRAFSDAAFSDAAFDLRKLTAPGIKGSSSDATTRIKLPAIPSGTESFASVIATNASAFTDSLVSQLTTNFDTAVAQEFLTVKEGKIVKRRMNKQAKVLKSAFTKFGNKANRLFRAYHAGEISSAKFERAMSRAVVTRAKKGKGSFGSPFRGKAPKKAKAAQSRVIIARQQRSVSGLFISFFQSLNMQLKTAATTSAQTALADSFQAALEKVLEKDIKQNARAADQALKSLYRSKKPINPALIARNYSGEDVYYTGGARGAVSVDVTFDAVTSMLSSFGGVYSAVFSRGLNFSATDSEAGTIVVAVSKGGTITANVTRPGASEPQVKIKGKVDVKKGTLIIDILEILDDGDYTAGGIRHRITTLNASSGSECNSFASMIGGQAKLSPGGELNLVFEEDISAPPGGVVNILSGSKDDTNKDTLAEVNTSSVTFPTSTLTLQLTTEQCTALNTARDFNLAVPQSPIDNTKTGDFTELGNGCNVTC